jgi:hypothetical protein
MGFFIMIPVLLSFFVLLQFAPPVKQEIETSIRASEFPASSLALLNPTLQRATDIRYFSESDGQTRSFEVKFWLDGARWSAEFSSTGAFEDVEIERRLTDLPQATASAIRATLNERFKNHTIRKLQEQYLSWPPDLGTPTAYELIVEGTSSKELGVFELTFSPSGSILEKRRVIEIPDL